MQRILVTGGAGQVGLELAGLQWPDGLAPCFPGRDELDLSKPESISAFLESGDIAAVVNTAAWTAVDAAEENVADCFLVNSQGPAWLAEAAGRAGVPMVHVSTDYVFDGSLDRPYAEGDPVAPVSVYGASKLAGEYAVRMANPKSVVLRTAWVLSPHRANFLKTMLRLGAERDELAVVADQRGCPTSAGDIAQAIQTIILRQLADPDAPAGIYHFVNAGEATWHELACAIFEFAGDLGRKTPAVRGITTDQFPTRARRPANSRLDISRIRQDFGIDPRPWRDAVKDIVGRVAGQEA